MNPKVDGFLGELTKRVVPECDPDVVTSVFRTASRGYHATRRRDGSRASRLTVAGEPFEASVTGGGGRADNVLRYTTEAATVEGSFAMRLVDQRSALRALTARLPAAARAAGPELLQFLDTLHPDPDAEHTRARFTSWFGIRHMPDEPRHLAHLKVYCGTRRTSDALAGLAMRRPAFGELGERSSGIPDLRPSFAALEVDAVGAVRSKLYLLGKRGARAAAQTLAERFGLGLELLADLPETVWEHPWFVGCVVTPAGPTVDFHLSARGFGRDPDSIGRWARELALQHHGTARLVEALQDAGASDPAGHWHHTFFGFGLRDDGIAKLSVYLAPGKRSAVKQVDAV